MRRDFIFNGQFRERVFCVETFFTDLVEFFMAVKQGRKTSG